MARTVVEGSKELTDQLRALSKRIFPQALSRAVNRTANTVKTRAARDIAEATGLGVGTVRRRIVLRKRASKHDPRAVLEISGNPLNLVHFASGSKTRPRSPRGGITAKPWGHSRKFRGVFLARMPNGHVIAVKRSAPGKERAKLIQKGKWAGKSPHIEAVHGPGIAREAMSETLTEARRAVVRERLEIELRHEIHFRIAREVVKRARRKR